VRQITRLTGAAAATATALIAGAVGLSAKHSTSAAAATTATTTRSQPCGRRLQTAKTTAKAKAKAKTDDDRHDAGEHDGSELGQQLELRDDDDLVGPNLVERPAGGHLGRVVMTIGTSIFSALGTTAQVTVADANALPAAVSLVERELEAIDLACSRFRERLGTDGNSPVTGPRGWPPARSCSTR